LTPLDEDIDDLDGEASDPGPESWLEVMLAASEAGERLDKALAPRFDGLSRARLQALLAEGRLTLDGVTISDGSQKAKPGLYRLGIPAPTPAEPQAENIPLSILYEDADLIVIDKPAGMAAHPAPGNFSGTLVNALLHHCRDSLSGVGGVARPGIVHRLDKETSGVMVAAKTDAAHQGLSKLFASHDIDRLYIALTRGAPHPGRGTIHTRLGRSPHDRKKMTILKSGGREAVTHYSVEQAFGPADKPVAARVACRLETGRTHQIRVHLTSKGTPCLGDPVYGGGQPVADVRAILDETGFARQALHAAVLGFVHPISGQILRFETPLPADMAALEAGLRAL
jgi:23S rRNA pseudouridine1911/1915/1917 synthase